MADTLVGFGLGLTGTPKDYTAIVAARERQKAADEERIKAAKLKEYDDVAKALVPKRMLPYQKEDYIIKTGDTLKKLQEAIQNGDNNTKNTLLTQHALLTSDLDNEYKAAEDYRVLSNRGSINADTKVSPDEIWNAKNRQEVIEKSGGDFKYNPQTGTLNFYPTAKYDVVDAYKKSAETVPTGAWKTVQITDAYGAKRMEAIPNEDEYLKNLRIQWDTNVQARENAIRNYKRKNNLSGTDYDTPEEQQKLFEKAEEDYLADGLEWGLKQKYQIIRKPGGGISIRNYMPSAPTTPRSDFGNISKGSYTFGRIKEDKTSVSNYGLDDVDKLTLNTSLDVTVPSSGIRSQDDGTVYSPSQVSNLKLGTIVVAPIWNSRIGSSVLEGTQADQSEVDNPEYAGKFDWTPIFIGTAEAPKYNPEFRGFEEDESGNIIKDIRNVYVPASQVKQAFINKLDDKDKAAFQNLYNQLERSANEKNAAIRVGGGSRSIPPTGGGGGGRWESYRE